VIRAQPTLEASPSWGQLGVPLMLAFAGQKLDGRVRPVRSSFKVPES
jgi:hypothetical protein